MPDAWIAAVRIVAYRWRNVVVSLMLRIVIGLYAAAGLVMTGLSVLIAWQAWAWWYAEWSGALPARDRWQEALLFAGLSFAMGLPYWAIALGLWRRWRLARPVVIGLSIYTLFVCGVVALIALAALAGIVDREVLRTREPFAVSLAIWLGSTAFSAFQIWVLTRRRGREEFQIVPAPPPSASIERVSSRREL